MPYPQNRPAICRGFACVRNTKGDFCEECLALRGQHAYSHKTEGHRTRVFMCPVCEGQ